MAVTVIVVFELTVGAVNSPALETDPAVADQVTAVLLDPVTAAANCWVPPEVTEAVCGEMEIDTAAGGLTTTVAAEDTELFASLVA